jgi:flagellar biosynthesis protein FliQ
MSTANPNYSFTIDEQNGTYTINWNPAKLGLRFALPLLWPSMIIGLVLTIWGMENNSNGIVTFIPKWIMWSVVLFVGTLLFVNFVLRRGGSFSFNKSGFILGATTYVNADIHGIYIKSPNGEKLETLTYTTYHGFGVAGAVSNTIGGINQISGQATRAMKEAVRNKSYKICIQYGEKEISLAKNITLQTAKALINKIDELI